MTIRLLGSDDFPAEARQQAARDLTRAADERALVVPTATPLSIEQVADAHDRVDHGSRGRVLLEVDPAAVVRT